MISNIFLQGLCIPNLWAAVLFSTSVSNKIRFLGKLICKAKKNLNWKLNEFCLESWSENKFMVESSTYSFWMYPCINVFEAGSAPTLDPCHLSTISQYLFFPCMWNTCTECKKAENTWRIMCIRIIYAIGLFGWCVGWYGILLYLKKDLQFFLHLTVCIRICRVFAETESWK